MAVLGILILLAVGVATATVIGNSESETLSMVGFDINTTLAGIYAIGALNALFAVLGLFLLLGGAKRARRRRKEVQDLRRQNEAVAPATAPPGTQAGTGTGPGADTRSGRGSERHGRRDDGHGTDSDGEHFDGAPREQRRD